MLTLRHASLLLVLLACVLPACEDGFRIGDKQIINAKHPLVASRIVVTRRENAEIIHNARPATQPAADAQTQKLVIDLDTGRASLTDTDGRVFQTSVAPEDLATLRAGIADRSWRVGSRNAPKGATTATQYTLTAYNGDRPYGDQAAWTAPTRNPLPPVMLQLESLFQRADRLARPLSNDINLLE
jgi:hypothetical protein